MKAEYSEERIINNDKDHPVEVWFEPWGMSMSFQSEESIRVVAASPTSGSIEIVTENDLIAVYGWSGCTMKVFRDMGLIFDLFQLPHLGDSPSPRQVVESLFGGPGGPR